MTNSNLLSIIQLRILVGYLGEQGQYSWWQSSFFSQDSSDFLEPIFPKTTDIARYHGVIEAGKLLHDKRIGVGRVFHLFRLPQMLEQSLFDYLREEGISDSIKVTFLAKEAAVNELTKQATGGVALSEGPIQIGHTGDLTGNDWLGMAAAHYLAALQAGVQSFPYLVEVA